MLSVHRCCVKMCHRCSRPNGERVRDWHRCAAWIKCASHGAQTARMLTGGWKRRWTISVRWPCHASSFVTASPADVRFVQLCWRPRTFLLWAPRPTERETMKDEVAPPPLCVSNLMTRRSLLWPTCAPFALIFFTPPLPIRRAAHQSVLVSGFLLLALWHRFPLWICQNRYV